MDDPNSTITPYIANRYILYSFTDQLKKRFSNRKARKSNE